MNNLKIKTIITAILLFIVAMEAYAADGEVVIGPTKIPFYTGNLSVYKFMMNYGTFPEGQQPASDWASPEHIAQLKRIGVIGDCDYQAWSIAEKEKGKWDFSLYEKNADLLHDAGFKYIVFCWVHFPPQWFIDSPDFVPYQCAEHNEKLIQLSPWAPNVWDIYRNYYKAQYDAMGSKVDWIRVATPSDYGEIGYPGGMTSWLVPQKHAHPGFWCGDPYAREDFRNQMKAKFKTLKALNARWGTSFANWADVTYPELADNKGAKIARESGKVTDRRRWLDFMDWYNGVWVKWVPNACSVIREFYPKTPLITSIGYGAENNEIGNDISALARMGKKFNLAMQTPGNIPYYCIKRVSSACHFYGTPYYTEPPGDVPPDAEVARFFSDISNGVQVYFEYPNNLDRAREKLRVYKEHMTGQKTVVDFAIFNSVIQFRLDAKGGFPEPSYLLGEVGRERFDYDVADETMINDGALKNYRVLAYVHGNVTEQSTLKKIADWVKNGGALVTCDIGDVESVEGDKSIWKSLVPQKLPKLDEVTKDGKWDWPEVKAKCVRKVGKGIVIQLPIKQDQRDLLVDAVAHAIYNLSEFGGGFKNAPLIDGEPNGISATLLPDRILYFTWKDNGVDLNIKLRPEDWQNRAKKPEKMEYNLKMAPYSIEAIMLK